MTVADNFTYDEYMSVFGPWKQCLHQNGKQLVYKTCNCLLLAQKSCWTCCARCWSAL